MITGKRLFLRHTWVRTILMWTFLLGYNIALSAQLQWHTEVVDKGADVGRQSSLAVDRFGAIHVSYFDATNQLLRYAYNDGHQWFRMIIDGHGAGNYSSLAVDSNGRPMVAYSSTREDGLRFAQFDGTKWTRMIIDPIHTQFYVSVKADSHNLPHISYYYTSRPDGEYVLNPKYAYFDGTQWYVQTVDSRFGTGKFNSLAVDAQGFPHIVYTNIRTGDLDYAHWDGTDWSYEVADARSIHNSYVAWGNSIVLDSKQMPHVAHFDGTKKTVRYSYRTASGWKTEVVASLSGYVASDLDHVSLKLDSNDIPHIAFYDEGRGTLNYASREADGKWKVETVDEGDVGLYPSLALDGEDCPVISYYDRRGHMLKVARVVSDKSHGQTVGSREKSQRPEAETASTAETRKQTRSGAESTKPKGPNN